MTPIRLCLIALALVASVGGPVRSAWALGEETFGNAPVNDPNYPDWPGLVPALNHTTRFYQSWVNGHEQFAGLGRADQINDLIKLYLAAGLKQPEIVLRPGPGHVQTFDQQQLPCDWEIEIYGGISRNLTRVDEGGQVWPATPRLTIYISKRVTCQTLEIPANAVVLDLRALKERFQDAMVNSKDTPVRGWGCGGLAAIDHFDPESAKAIAARLSDENNWVRINAAGALKSFGKLATPHRAALEKAMEGADLGLKPRIEETLAAIAAAPDTTAAAKEHATRQAEIEAWLAARAEK